MNSTLHTPVSKADIEQDIESILWSMNLYKVRRYWKQRFWEKENANAEYAELIEPFPRLETVGEHSWHVADIALLLAPHFEFLDIAKCLSIAILHDKLEIIMGDKNPIGQSGRGDKTHAFNLQMQERKDQKELEALDSYSRRLCKKSAELQSEIIRDLIDRRSDEALFIKAIDKIQALAYITTKKQGLMNDQHIDFTLSYTRKAIEYFPPLAGHYHALRSRLIKDIARVRNTSVDDLEKQLNNQPSLF